MNLIASRHEKPVSVRLPRELRARLDAAVARSGRSLNREIIERLASTLATAEAANATDGQGSSSAPAGVAGS